MLRELLRLTKITGKGCSVAKGLEGFKQSEFCQKRIVYPLAIHFCPNNKTGKRFPSFHTVCLWMFVHCSAQSCLSQFAATVTEMLRITSAAPCNVTGSSPK